MFFFFFTLERERERENMHKWGIEAEVETEKIVGRLQAQGEA